MNIKQFYSDINNNSDLNNLIMAGINISSAPQIQIKLVTKQPQ